MSHEFWAVETIKALQTEAEAAHRRVDAALEGSRELLQGTLVRYRGKTYQITRLVARCGIVHAIAVRYQYKRPRVRPHDLGKFTELEFLKWPKEGDTNRASTKTRSGKRSDGTAPAGSAGV